jgi:hypothetical protein
MKQARLFYIFAALGVLAGCSAALNSGPTYTVQGTIVAASVDVGSSDITVTQGSNSYSVSVPVAASQTTWTYSVSGVPAGTYTVSISHPRTSSGYGGNYSVNGVGPYSLSAQEPAGVVIFTTGSITVGADLQLDANTGVL